MNQPETVLWFDTLDLSCLPQVGGKNASLGEMYQRLSEEGIRVPFGFATTAQAFRDYLADNRLEAPIREAVAAMRRGSQSLEATGGAIRELIRRGNFSNRQRTLITGAYRELCERLQTPSLAVAVRSSATAEDLPEASFAGQQESFLNVRGEEALLQACRECYASLYTDRAIAYREERGFEHEQVALSVGVQQMVESAAAGVMFTLDTESGFPDVVLISAAWGLGETVVKGSVNPDRYMAYKPFLEERALSPVIEASVGSKLVKMRYALPEDSQPSDADDDQGPTVTVPTSTAEQRSRVLDDVAVLHLARWGARIEAHYGRPMDIEWARDSDGQLFIVQARPETIESQKDRSVLVSYHLKEKGRVLLEGAAVGSAIAGGPVCVVDRPGDVDAFPEGAILVTERTDPDWVPIMRYAWYVFKQKNQPRNLRMFCRGIRALVLAGAQPGHCVRI